MSLTSTVPAGVPSLFHSSASPAASFATKYSVLPTAVSSAPETELMFGKALSSAVLPAVLSLFHSSTPCGAPGTRKKSVVPTAVSAVGFESAVPPRMSVTRTVPAGVPSLFHSSTPQSSLSAAKNSVPFTSTGSGMPEPVMPWRMSATSVGAALHGAAARAGPGNKPTARGNRNSRGAERRGSHMVRSSPGRGPPLVYRTPRTGGSPSPPRMAPIQLRPPKDSGRCPLFRAPAA